MRSIALLSLAQGRPEEAAALLRDGALPLFEAALGEEHPDLMFTSGLVGVAQLETAHSPSQSQPQPQPQHDQHDQHDLGVARTLVTSALDFLSRHEYGPYAPDHPWVAQLGGFSEAQVQRRGEGGASEIFGRGMAAAHAEELEEWAAQLLLPSALQE
jgi:hypothetical protein